MKSLLKLLAAAAVLVSLSGCVVVPPRAHYVGPRVEIVGGGGYHHHGHRYYPGPRYPYRRDWDRW